MTGLSAGGSRSCQNPRCSAPAPPITAHGCAEDESLLAGADGYLSKPFHLAGASLKIGNVLSTSAA